MDSEDGRIEYCEVCGRIKGVGCACDMTFAEKIRTLAVDRHSLLDHDRQLREAEKHDGSVERRREWAARK